MACRRTGNAVSDQRWNARRKIERGGGCGARTANARLTHGLGGSLGEALTLREACQLSGAVEMQREAQSLALSVHGPDTQAQHLCDLARAIAERHRPQDLPLALGEVGRAVAEVATFARRGARGHLGGDRAIPATRADLVQRPEQLLAAVLLQQVSERTRLPHRGRDIARPRDVAAAVRKAGALGYLLKRSEEHTSELQSQSNHVCR